MIFKNLLLVSLFLFSSDAFAARVLKADEIENNSVPGAVLKIPNATFGAGVVQSDAMGNMTSSALGASSVLYAPNVPTNWLNVPVSVAEALDNLADAKIGNLWFVSRTVGVDSASCGMALNPCATISQALTNAGPAANADEVKEGQTFLIEAGAYDESITIPDGRFVNLIALGTVILGDAAGANLASTTPRNVTFNPTNASVFGTALKPSLTIGAINGSEMSSTFVGEANGFIFQEISKLAAMELLII
jgi:hypothetical protein